MKIPSEQPTPKKPPRLLLNPVLEDLPAYPLVRMDERRRELEEKGVRLFDFGTGDPREPTDETIRQTLIDNVPETSRYPSAAGTRELREAFAGFMRRRHGVVLDPDTEILPAAGSKEAIFHAPLAFVHPSHERSGIAYGTPGYPVYERGTLFAGGETLPVRLCREDEFLLPAGVLDPAKTRALWINYPHNPTGATATRAYLEETASFCREHDILLFSDECYNDVYSGDPPPSILEVTRERTLAFVSLSKRSGMTGYRSAMIAGDPELIAALKKLRPSIGVASPGFVQHAATAAWSDDAHVEERNQIFAAKRALFESFFEKAGLRWTATNASLYLWVEVPEGYGGDDETYALKLLEEGILVAPGSSFGPGGGGYFRVALVPSVDECEEAIARWEGLAL
ncbi:MAG: N-succinyl-L,L-diaminopimelate aminotransferase, type 2 [uncultured Rubrobacteraceae bacterium]|uniref:N-succinyl-L,L-diaminopimelate aminotransferase, type 2 n=1 Tax=uncultured Rubrobacteraceae bacterium TaxID=349277 RepID=A0A6J4PNV6_9ACTN|nr:MAG: N-succinyl-L,L-diaminopimelate aminotransferase, type 2 [uncultured Rubrobacteraceae bacterium]